MAVQEINRMKLLKEIMTKVASSTQGGTFRVDCSIARGLGYYTGVVFETTLDSIPGFGSIASGGRYDNLAERFSNRSLPGVGGSIGLDRLMSGLEEINRLPQPKTKMLFIAIATDDALGLANTLAANLRHEGIACDIGLTTGKVGNQFKHADRLGCPFVITIGTEELLHATYNVKNMKSGGETKSLPLANVVEHMRGLLADSEA
jgi:histidyl-tRNA synthetase